MEVGISMLSAISQSLKDRCKFSLTGGLIYICVYMYKCVHVHMCGDYENRKGTMRRKR